VDNSGVLPRPRARKWQVILLLVAIFGVLAVPFDTTATTLTSCMEQGRCESSAYENSAGGGYTGVKDHHYVLDLDNWYSAGHPVYQTMWLHWKYEPSPSTDQWWIELGTLYEDDSFHTFSYECKSTTFCKFLFKDRATTIGDHVYRISRETVNHTYYELFVDGSLIFTATSPYESGDWVGVGLESYNLSLTVETHAYYNLKYMRGDGDFRDWAGRDAHSTIEYPMCGQWHLDTSWWAGEYTTCS
jgi:hypothetical protein